MAAQLDLVRAVNVFGYVATLAAYRDGQPWLDDLLHYLEGQPRLPRPVRGGRTCRASPCRSPRERIWPGSTAARRTLPKNDPFTFFLEQAKVALNDGAAFGTPGEGFARLNFACPRALLTEGLDRMRRALASR